MSDLTLGIFLRIPTHNHRDSDSAEKRAPIRLVLAEALIGIVICKGCEGCCLLLHYEILSPTF